jgi:hypothetical protein
LVARQTTRNRERRTGEYHVVVSDIGAGESKTYGLRAMPLPITVQS